MSILQNWLEKEVKIISFDREDSYDIEEDYTCPVCCVVTKYILVLVLITFFSVVPGFMIYTGLTYQYCEDIFSVWLLLGNTVISNIVLFIYSFTSEHYNMSLIIINIT